jgi:uncharacterized protein YndB with AHSA1/START domain
VKTVVSGGLVLKEIPIQATPSRVFDALTRPPQLKVWFTTGAKVDLRAGGKYSNADHDRGRFLEINRGKLLRFTWDNPEHAAGSIVEIILTRQVGRTLVTLLHYNFKRKSDLDHYSSRISGWDWALDNLKSYLEGRRIVQYEKWLERRSRR